jgi:hypothetical protein
MDAVPGILQRLITDLLHTVSEIRVNQRQSGSRDFDRSQHSLILTLVTRIVRGRWTDCTLAGDDITHFGERQSGVLRYQR